MKNREWTEKARAYLDTLCGVKPNRRVGSKGNRVATEFFALTAASWKYEIDATSFPCLDHECGEASLKSEGALFDIRISPYSLACDVTARLVTASTIEELAESACRGNILLLKGILCAEQLMPKNFVFYNPDHHKKVYTLLEEKQPAAIITATGRNPAAVGALDPFPLIEDGDFEIPCVYCTEKVGDEISAKSGEMFKLKIQASRIPSTACNVIAGKNSDAMEKIVFCAHIDAKEDTPGALDDASGVVVELLLAEMLKGYTGPMGLEIIAFNGEDHYSAGGQMDYLRRHQSDFDKISVAVNIDDVGYLRGQTAYSFYECPNTIRRKALAAFRDSPGILEGEPWYQGDHMIFAQKGKASIAITSEMIHELMAHITHTPKDVPELVDCAKLVELACALRNFMTQF
jgi:aminopeptidase YwaD